MLLKRRDNAQITRFDDDKRLYRQCKDFLSDKFLNTRRKICIFVNIKTYFNPCYLFTQAVQVYGSGIISEFYIVGTSSRGFDINSKSK